MRTGVGVEMIRNLAHVAINREPPDSVALSRGRAQTRDKMFADRLGGRHPMLTPDDHGRVADLAIGHPTVIIFAIPMGYAIGPTEFARRSHPEARGAVGPRIDGYIGPKVGA